MSDQRPTRETMTPEACTGMDAEGEMMVWLVVLLVLLPSCAEIEPVAFNGPHGRRAYSMKCGGMGGCYKKAGELCSEGYGIVDRAFSVVGSGRMIVPQYRLAIECKS